MKSKTQVADLCKKQRTITGRGLSNQYDNTDACRAFYNGDTMTYEDKVQFADTTGRKRRALVRFNKVQSNVDGVAGFMAQNRRQAKYIARVNANQGQQTYSRFMNALYVYHRENMHADQIESDQDTDMLVCGYGATETDLSYIVGNATTDPNGEILKVKLDPRRVGWDPTARAKNLLDARWAYYYDDYELKDALGLFQGSSEDDFERVSAVDTDDGNYTYNPWGGLYDKIRLDDTVEWSSKEEDMVRVYNHQWMEYETFYKCANPLYTAETPIDGMYIKIRLDTIASEIDTQGPENIDVDDMFSFDPQSEELFFNEKTKTILVREFGDLIDPVPFKRKVFYTAVLSGRHVFTVFRSISQQGFSIKFKTGSFNETGKFWIGMVNAMMEPQKYYNKSLTELLFTIAANSKGGVMVEEEAVEDISDFETKWAKTDAVITVAPGALSGGKIQEKTKGAVPTGLENIITLSDSAISAAGVDPSFLGALDRDDQSGILYKRRIRQVISKMAKYFDSITLYQKEDARLCADLILIWVQNNNGQFIRITGEDGVDEFAQVSEDKMAPEYDVSIQEAPLTPEDKQETAQLLGTYGDRLVTFNPDAAQSFYAESLQYIPQLDGDVRNRLIKKLQPDEQQIDPQQVQVLVQRVQELESELAQADIKNKQADALLKQAKAQREQALTAKDLEDAANKGLENDIIRSGDYKQATVTI